MNYKDLDLKKFYDSDEDNLLTEFYIPVLSKSISYKRIAGYFSSTSFMVAAKGLANLFNNGGFVKLILNVGISKSDYDAILSGIENPEKVISDIFLNDLLELEDELIKNHIKILAWLIANNKLEIKVATTIRTDRGGIFHQKIGVLEDELGNCISFSGSDNESANGWVYNIEEFKVFRSWIPEEKDFVEADRKRFDKFWSNEGIRTNVYSFPMAVKERILEIGPTNIEEYKLACNYVEENKSLLQKLRKPRDYQVSAITAWFENGGKGIFEMATGTGKSFTAITALKEVIEQQGGLLCVVVCPFQHLVTQWSSDLTSENLTNHTAYGSKNRWKDKLMNDLLKLNMGYIGSLIVVTTYDTFSSDVFKEIINSCKKRCMLIGDEIHSVGSDKRREGLLDLYEFRMGLSATPTRWLDDEGTKVIEDYFGGTVFKFDLTAAIVQGFLTPYFYYPHFIELTKDEMSEYNEYAKKIAIALSKKDSDKSQSIELLLIKRKKIIINAVNKNFELIDILDSVGDIQNCLIYCSPNQLGFVYKELAKRGIIFHRFTSKENINERKQIQDKFISGEYSVLVAMKCLDEGVDIPSTEMGIIMASSGNPKEYIQRRGRLLRKFPGKSKAIIHDIIVLPSMGVKLPSDNLEYERKILKGELSRYRQFAESSLNPLFAMEMIMKIEDSYNIGDYDEI